MFVTLGYVNLVLFLPILYGLDLPLKNDRKDSFSLYSNSVYRLCVYVVLSLSPTETVLELMNDGIFLESNSFRQKVSIYESKAPSLKKISFPSRERTKFHVLGRPRPAPTIKLQIILRKKREEPFKI